MPIVKIALKALWFIIKSLLTTAVVVGLFLLYSAKIEPNWIQIREQPVYINGLPSEFEGFRIVQISDLHGKLFPEKKLVRLVNGLKPDIVAITGDVFDEYHDVPVEYVEQALRGMTAKHGVYYVFGNNDIYLGEKKVVQAMEAINIRTLANEKVAITLGDQRIDLIGLKYPRQQKVDIQQLIGGLDGTSTILLAHRPEIIDPAKEADIDLVLVGHTHGGQIQLPFVPRFVTGVKRGYEKYEAGLFTEGNTQMYVNRGLGESNTPLRFLTRPEITVVTLRSK